MKNLLPQIKAVAKNVFTLSVELLRLIDGDELQHREFLEKVKKTPTGKFYIFLSA